MKKDYKKRQRILTAVMLFGILLIGTCPAVYATEAGDITAKIDALKELVLGIVQSAGAIVLLWGIFEFASAYQSHDTTQQTASLKKVISGILMVAAGTIVSIVS